MISPYRLIQRTVNRPAYDQAREERRIKAMKREQAKGEKERKK